jgi:hypothetical protein
MELKIKENSSTVLLKVYDNDDDFTRCNYAVVKFTKTLLEEISKLRKGREAMGNYEVNNFNYSCNFLAQDEFEDEEISEELVEELEDFTKGNEGVWQIEDVDLSDVPTLRTDADTIHVSEFGVKWVAYGKYSGVELSTEKISWEVIDQMIVGD